MPHWEQFLKNTIGGRYIEPNGSSTPPQNTNETEVTKQCHGVEKANLSHTPLKK